MKYKTANILRFWLMLAGLCVSGLSIVLWETPSNIMFFSGVIIILIGMLIGFVFYRCPKCGSMLSWRPVNLKYCNNCGEKLD